MNVLMTGGGTGGHVNPAIAIANTIKKNIPDANIAFVGTPKGMENKLVAKEGYKMYHVDIQGIRRSLSLSNIKTAYLALVSPIKAKKIVREFKPDVVIGTGGYVCWPILVAASRMGVATAVHESNAVPGVATKRLEAYTDRIFLNFEDTAQYLKKKEKLVHVGNPLRSSFEAYDRESARRELGIDESYKKIIVSYGGSLGAHAINKTMLDYMEKYAKNNSEICVIHATGSREYESIKAEFEARGLDKYPNLMLYEYIYNMPVVMSAADVVISRAGAMTVSELALKGKNCILVPSPNVTNNHQYKNAKVLADVNAAILIKEEDYNADSMNKEISQLFISPEKCKLMSENIKRFALTDANKIIYNEIMSLIGEKREQKSK